MGVVDWGLRETRGEGGSPGDDTATRRLETAYKVHQGLCGATAADVLRNRNAWKCRPQVAGNRTIGVWTECGNVRQTDSVLKKK